MTRRLLNLVTALSLLLFVAVVGLWVRSSVLPYEHKFTRNRPMLGEVPKGPVSYHFRSNGAGVTLLAVQGHRENRPFSWLVGSGPVIPEGEFTPQTSAGLELRPLAVIRGTGSMRAVDLRGPGIISAVPFAKVHVSYSLLAAVAAVLPVARGAARVAWRVRCELRHNAGLCSNCGYDLRATPGRCPECGKIATWISPAP